MALMSVILLVLLFIVAVLFLLLGTGGYEKIRKYRRMCTLMRKIPGMPPHWFWGNLDKVKLTEESFTMIHEWRYKNKAKLMRFWIGPFDATVFLTDPRQLKKILNEPKAENVYAMLEPWLGPGLLIANGNRWHRSRRLLTPAFHFDILKPYVHIYNECTQELLSKWQHSVDAGNTVDLCESIKRLTLDVLLQCSCSYQSGCQKDNCNDPYVLAVDELVHLSADRFMSPILQSSNFLYMYCTPQGWKYRNALRKVHGISMKIIQERKQAFKDKDSMYHKLSTAEILKLAKSSKTLDFLDVLLAAQDEDGYGLTDMDIRYEVDTFMFEGHDTTANGITFALYLLALYPEHQEKCREEVREVLRGRDRLDYDDLPRLQYISWCIKEALRRFTPVFTVFRRLTEDVEIDGYLLPKDLWITLDLMGIHLNPEVWDNPNEFNPLRFHPDNNKSKSSFSFVPFSAGPRNCIGQNFAINEEKVVIGSILNRFELKLTSDETLEYIPKVVLRPKTEIKLKLIPLLK